MVRAHDVALRWLVVYQRLILGKHWRAVQRDLGGLFCKKTQAALLHLFWETDDVVPHQGQRPAPPTNQLMDGAFTQLLIDTVVKHPQLFHRERQAYIQLQTMTSGVRRVGRREAGGRHGSQR